MITLFPVLIIGFHRCDVVPLALRLSAHGFRLLHGLPATLEG
jgi:hypothetical protein